MVGGDADILEVCRQTVSTNWSKMLVLTGNNRDFLTHLCSSSQVEEEKCGNSFCCACVAAGGPRFPQGGRHRRAGCSHHRTMVHGPGREENTRSSRWRGRHLVPATRWVPERLLRPGNEAASLNLEPPQAQVHSQPWWICGGWVEGWWSTALPCLHPEVTQACRSPT